MNLQQVAERIARAIEMVDGDLIVDTGAPHAREFSCASFEGVVDGARFTILVAADPTQVAYEIAAVAIRDAAERRWAPNGFHVHDFDTRMAFLIEADRLSAEADQRRSDVGWGME